MFNTSSGSDHPYTLDGVRLHAHTPEGVFTVIRQVDGSDNEPARQLWRPKYFTWHGHRGARLHDVPPYPASHGCVRVSNDGDELIWAHNILPIGTTVWVYV